MRLIKLFLILSVFVSLMSCIKRTTKKSGLDTSMIESLDGPRVIRDTIIKEIIIEKEVEDTRDIVQIEQPTRTQPKAQAKSYSSQNSASSQRANDDSYDRGNSGFFDQYQNNYDGDPNRNLQPITRVVNSGADDIERKKQALEKSLNVLEQRNQQEQQRYEQLERERQAVNDKAIQKAKEQQKSQQQKPRGKTLDTDLLLNGK